MLDTIDVRKNHALYEGADESAREAIGVAFQAAADVLKASGFKLNMADPAEELVAGITSFLVRSDNDLSPKSVPVEASDTYGML